MDSETTVGAKLNVLKRHPTLHFVLENQLKISPNLTWSPNGKLCCHITVQLYAKSLPFECMETEKDRKMNVYSKLKYQCNNPYHK